MSDPTTCEARPITPGDVQDAAARIGAVTHRTPVLGSAALDSQCLARVFCKAEALQRTGSFKIRGASNKILSLAAEQRRQGLFAASSGNHAQAVASMGRRLEVSVTILMPRDAPSNKRAATEAYGAQILDYDRYQVDREQLAEQVSRERGLVRVPAYDDPLVMAGQGTVALELIEQVGTLDVLVVPVGGGGLSSGCATIAHHLCPGIEVVGVEPVAGDDTRRSLEAGVRTAVAVPRTIADGLQATTPGELTFAVNQRLVDRVELVTDAQLVAAMSLAFDRLKVVLEPSGAAALAAVIALGPELAGRRVGVVLSGGNISSARFGELIRTLSE